MKLVFLPGLCLATALFAQSSAPPVQFEVASIRPAPPLTADQQTRVNVGLHLDGAQVKITSLSLRDYIAMAYRVKTYQITGPDSLTDRFDIGGKLPDGAKLEQLPEMMQALLVERFGLRMHKTQKDAPTYVLVRGKRPLTLKEVKIDEASTGAIELSGSGSNQGISVNLGRGAAYTFANNKFEGKKLSMATLTDTLAAYVDLPVVDQTGLEGNYDFTLDVTQEDYRAMLIRAGLKQGIAMPPQVQKLAEASTPSLFDAIENLGLKLESRKIPQDVIVVDNIAKAPTEN